MQMKAFKGMKVVWFCLLVLITLSLTSCADSSWLKLVGRWQDVENPSFELEFTNGGRYREYLYGQSIGYGEFRAEGSSLSLHYLSPCGVQAQVDCDVNLRFRVTGDILIITDIQGDIPYRKVSGSQ